MAVGNPALNLFGKFIEGMGFLSGIRFTPATGALTLGAIGYRPASPLGVSGPVFASSKIEVGTRLRRQE